MKRWVWVILGGLIIISSVFFVELQQNSKRCKNVVVQLDNKAEYPFFTEKDIKNSITLQGADVIEGMSFSNINFKGLEKRVLKNRLIKKCDVFRDLSGNLVVKIEQQRPIGRILGGFSNKNQSITGEIGGYLTEQGDIIPLSGRFAARVVILSGVFFKKSKNIKSSTGKSLIEFLKNLQQNSFWRAQITEVVVAEDGELTLIPQVGQHQIDFGLPEDAEIKFEKLKVFYKTVLPVSGWEKYHRVSVKFKNQIVCE